eukprot:scaffold27578_cov21-Phaeocystis_antarctica.AAC.1
MVYMDTRGPRHTELPTVAGPGAFPEPPLLASLPTPAGVFKLCSALRLAEARASASASAGV